MSAAPRPSSFHVRAAQPMLDIAIPIWSPPVRWATGHVPVVLQFEGRLSGLFISAIDHWPALCSYVYPLDGPISQDHALTNLNLEPSPPVHANIIRDPHISTKLGSHSSTVLLIRLTAVLEGATACWRLEQALFCSLFVLRQLTLRMAHMEIIRAFTRSLVAAGDVVWVACRLSFS